MLDSRLIISPEARSEMRWMNVMIDDCSISQCDQKANRVVDLTPNLWQLSKCFNAHSGTSGCESAIIALYFSGVLPLYKQREARQQHCHRRFAHHRLFTLRTSLASLASFASCWCDDMMKVASPNFKSIISLLFLWKDLGPPSQIIQSALFF